MKNMKHTSRGTNGICAIPIMLALAGAGCGEGIGFDEPAARADEDAVETITQALDGTWSSLAPFCDSSQAPKITKAIKIANANVRSAKMRECLTQSLQSYTESFPEVILDQLKLDTPLGTWVSCRDLGGANAEAPVYGIIDERLYLDPDFLAGATARDVAAVITHEVAHNRGYQHPMNNSSSTLNYLNALEYKYTVNEQVEACSRAISNGVKLVGNGPRRDDLDRETRLAPTGWAGGTGFYTQCPSGQVAMGVHVRSGTYVDAIGLSCRNPNGNGTISRSGPYGGGGGTPRSLECQPGEVLVGLHGRAASVNDQVGAICASAAAVLSGSTSAIQRDAAGGDGGHRFVRRCPARMAVRAIKGKAANVVDRIELECQALDHLDPVVLHGLDYAGGTGGNTTNYETCAGRAALVGLTFHTGDRVDRLGGKCMPVTSCAGCSPQLRTSTNDDYPFMLTAWGGTGGYTEEATCGAGRALVGVEVWAEDSGVNGIRGLCADPAAWFAGSPGVSTLALRGRAIGTKETRQCAAGELLVGWKIRTGTYVDGLHPICRAF